MTLTLDTNFEDFHSFVLQDQESCEYREVYKAMNKEGKEVRLILYLNAKLPACYPDRKFNESNIRCTLHYDAFPHVFQRDTCIYHDEDIEWMATEWIDGKSLAEWMTENKAMEMEKVLPLFLEILYGIRELASITEVGGHYNITPYHIILRKSQQGENEPFIIGMEHAANPCNRSTPLRPKLLMRCVGCWKLL
jgi:serine/threonine protein kinase